VARSLRELCIHAAIPLPPELEGPINSDHAGAPLSDLSRSGASAAGDAAAEQRAGGDAAPTRSPPLADMRKPLSSKDAGSGRTPNTSDSSSGTAHAAANAIAAEDRPGADAGGGNLPEEAAAAASLAEAIARAAAAGQEGAAALAGGGLAGPVVIAIAPPIAAGVEAGDPQAIASAATAAATAVLSQVRGSPPATIDDICVSY